MFDLSICIPTYNRSDHLKATLDSIVSQPLFIETNKVQIVLSDNASTDNTALICNEFTIKYPNKIKYVRKKKNVGAVQNVIDVLKLGDGKFLKLNNDTLVNNRLSLDVICNNVSENDSETLLFFSNSAIPNLSTFTCRDLDSLVEVVSFNSTWLACIGYWKNDIDQLSKDFMPQTKFPHIELMFQIVDKSKKPTLVNNDHIYSPAEVNNKGGYNIYDVFLNHYLGILTHYVEKNSISLATMAKEKRRLLFRFIIPWHIRILLFPNKYAFQLNNWFSILFSHYSKNLFFYFSPILIPYKIMKIYWHENQKH